MGSPLLPPVFVNGVEIPAAAIAAEAQNHPAPPGKPGLAWRAAAQALALREACLQSARAEGLQAEPCEVKPGQWETADEALVRAYLDAHIRPGAPDDRDLRARYDAAPDRFRAPDLWEAAHILIAERPGAKAEAEALCRDLSHQPQRFAELAARHSACSSARSGGLLGQIGPGDTVPAFEAAMRALRPGQITAAPVATGFGWHVIRLDAHARGEVLPFEAVLPKLREAAAKASWARQARGLAEQVLAKADVTGLSASWTA